MWWLRDSAAAGCIVIGLGATPLMAQPDVILEIQVGVSHSYAGVPEGPSVPAIDVAILGWLDRNWALALRHIYSRACDRMEPPVPVGDRVFLGTCGLRSRTVVARRRFTIAGDVELDVGAGLGFRKYRQLSIRVDDGGQQVEEFATPTSAGGVPLEILVGRRFARHFALRIVATYDWGTEVRAGQLGVLVALPF